MAIYLKLDNKTIESLDDLLNNLFVREVYNSLGSCTTYHDPECTEIQSIGLYRSLTDILEMCQTYGLEVTIEDIIKKMFEDKYFIMYCNNINKIVSYKNLNKKITLAYDTNTRHSFRSFDVECVDGFTIRDFLTLAPSENLIAEIAKYKENNNIYYDMNVGNNILLFLEELGRYNKTS